MQVGQCKTDTISPLPTVHFGSPGGTPGAVTPLAGPLGRSPSKWESQCLQGQTYVSVLNFSQIRLADLEKMHPKEIDRQTANFISCSHGGHKTTDRLLW